MQTKKILFYVLFLLTAIGCTTHRQSDIVKTADSLLWADPDSCLVYCRNHQSNHSLYDSRRLELIYQHAYFKVTGELANDSTLDELKNKFSQQNDYRNVGEAEYIQGAYYVCIGRHMEATLCLKEAEEKFELAHIDSPRLQGMLYLYLGAASERSRFFGIAEEYYMKALPYLKKNDNPIYVSSVFQHLAKCNTNTDSACIYLDSAYVYATRSNNLMYQKEIEVLKSTLIEPRSKEELCTFINNLYYLCDTCQLYYYSAYLIKAFIETNQVDLANEYLLVLSQDTTTDIWNTEQYYTLQAEIAYKQGKHEEAYNTLKQLHEWQTAEIENSAYASTYIISQRYDAAKEQELRLQETVKKQRAYIWIVVVLLICIIVGGYSFYINKKRKLELQLSAEQKKRLEEELSKNRAILRARISERLEIAKRLYQWSSHHAETVPDILGSLSPKQAASDQQHWKEFYIEFNLCYDNLLSRLKENYPALTYSDLQYIALTFLDFDITDISFLLNITNRTIWNRRNSIKKHLGMSEDADLDGWINSEMGDVQSISSPKLCTSGA